MLFSGTTAVSYGQELFIYHDPFKKPPGIKKLQRCIFKKQKVKALGEGM